MPDQPNQPGQRNIASHGDHNVNVSGDCPTIHVHQVPPLPPLSPRHQLRAPVSDFVGREKQINDLLAALRTSGQSNMACISGISGLGGIGKTELALVVAAHLVAEYPDAQLLVELHGAEAQPRATTEALADCICAFLGADARRNLPEDEASLKRLYLECLTGKRVLVVLDNAADAAQIHPLSPPPGCAVLVTSRENLHLPGLRARIQLDELAPAEAHALLQEMTAASRGPQGIADAVADQICYLCGYLPLAVRAAGGLLDVTPDLDAADYAKELHDERQRLALHYTNAEGRTVSVEASFMLSYRRLSAEAARVFRALAVFPADFDSAAVEAIAADAGHKQLSDLLRRNLVRYDATTKRYQLLDLARVFTNAQTTDEAERTAWQRSHARYFCELLAKANELYLAGGAQVTAGLALYDSESANIAAGQTWVARHAADDEVVRLRMNYANAGYLVLALRLHPRERIRWLTEQLAAARQLKEREYEGVALGNLGVAHKELGEPRKAIEFHEQHLLIARELGDRRGEGIALGNLGVAYADLGEPSKAIEYYEQYLVIARALGDWRNEGNALGNLGAVYAELDEPLKAIKFYEQHWALARENGDWRGAGNVLGNLGIALNKLGKPHQAIEYHKQSLILKREIGDRRGEGNSLGNLGTSYLNLGEPRQAIEFYEQALVVRRTIGDRRGEGSSLWNLALAWEQLGDHSQAIASAEAALPIFEAIESPHAAMVREALAKWRQ